VLFIIQSTTVFLVTVCVEVEVCQCGIMVHDTYMRRRRTVEFLLEMLSDKVVHMLKWTGR